MIFAMIWIEIQRSGITAAQLPPGNNLDEQILVYFQSTGNFEDFANSIMNDSDGPQSVITELPTVDTTAAALTGYVDIRRACYDYIKNIYC